VLGREQPTALRLAMAGHVGMWKLVSPMDHHYVNVNELSKSPSVSPTSAYPVAFGLAGSRYPD
jgi:hypothetical protein